MDLDEASNVDHSDEDEIHSASEDSDTGTEDDGDDVVDIGSGADNEDEEDADEVEPVSEVPEAVRPMEQRGAAVCVPAVFPLPHFQHLHGRVGEGIVRQVLVHERRGVGKDIHGQPNSTNLSSHAIL